MSGLAGKTALVTGGATGIGAGICRVLRERGARVAVLQRDARKLESLPAGTPGFQADISDRAAVERAVEAAWAALGGIDILVNNSSKTGTIALGGFLECTPEHIDAIVDSNLKGTIHVSQLTARRMAERGRGGSIVHVASVGGYAAQELASVYCATKAAQISLAQGMALELAPYGIRVNAVAPGDIRTAASAEIRDDVRQAGGSGRYLRVTPLGRQGTPEEIGAAVAFLASDEASFVTGATLLVDGGFLAY